ncbi:hypothetical protein E4U41_007208 [Claviceps citrina]|nr:hypothetical protein E4U41_007208 [Claviceps citrina]
MQTVPSLVGTGTAIAAAASGLVFGLPADQSHTTEYDIPTTVREGVRGHKRTVSIDQVLPKHSASSSTISPPPSRRPATSWAVTRSIGSEIDAVAGSVRQTGRPPLSRRHRPKNLQVSPSSSSSRHPSLVGDHWKLLPSPAITEEFKESSTWTNSWFRRLSNRPSSQHGGAGSCILADSTSSTVSHGSTAPVRPRSGSVLKPLSPNKLVKRSISRPKQAEGGPSCSPKGQLPSLRRPATSHQRSATLQQLRAELDVAGSSPHPKYSFDEPVPPEELLGASPIEDVDLSPRTRRATRKLGWASFFHVKTGQAEARKNSHGRLGSYSDVVFGDRGIVLKRLHPGNRLSRSAGAHLVKPRMVSASSTVSGSLVSCHLEEGDAGGKGRRLGDGMDSPPQFEVAPGVASSARPRRSFSCSFSHPTDWTSKGTAAGSLRRSNRGAIPHERRGSDNQRHMSAPAGSSLLTHTHSTVGLVHHHIDHASALDSSAAALPGPAPQRTAAPSPPSPSSPPSPLSHVPASHLMRLSQPSGSSTSSASAAASQPRGSHYERFFALGRLDGEARDLNSGDEDDTDFRSDVLFDSLRTIGSGRLRAVETPLESVYDESPPSTGGNKKSKRSSIRDILDRTWNEDGGRIMEEDECSATPVRAGQRPFHTEPSPSPRTRQITSDVGRFSLHDDFDEDWTRDEDDASSHALPSPSRNNILHSNGANINPNVRLALANIGGNSGTVPKKIGLVRSERSLGNLFDWSEPSAHDKRNPAGGGPRPHTAYGKQLGDSRGGRSVMRKGPVPTHVRSQSVPVVHEGTEDSKLMGPKYSTWGLGTKTVSEDWDEDFDFAGDNNGPGGMGSRNLFAVPESIRASQPSVKAHSGQIREFSLLVNDLKRLCRHGRELNMLNGDRKSVWKEAEGIIALASPDEDHVHDDDQSGSSVYVDAPELNGPRKEEERVDLPAEIPDAVLERNEPAMSKTAVVRERQSPRRKSVLSPDDDRYGSSWPLTDERPRPNRPSRPRTPENRPTNKLQDVNVVVRSVVETMQNRSMTRTGDSSSTHNPPKRYNATNRMHFDTNSLKALVRRAGELRDTLSDMIRKADQLTQSPVCTPRHERRLDSSPAFTRVFDNPGSSPARRSVRTRGSSNALLDHPSPESSSPSNMSRRVPLMTVK